MSFTLNNDEKLFLIQLARKRISEFLTDKSAGKADYFSDSLKVETGVFVTLHMHGQLRGCIGYVEGYKPLQDAVADLAVSAAFNDPRFEPLKEDELDEVDLEISVLTPLLAVNDISEINIGTDGLLIKKQPFQGLLLPQVASEYGWDVETFLEQTCHKAHLPEDAWKDEDTEIFRYSALIFSEHDFEE